MANGIKRSDVISRLAQRRYTKKDAEVILNDVFAVIKEALANGEDVAIYGFGKFEIRHIKDRESMNVTNHQKYIIPAHKIPRFVPYDSLKRTVAEGIVRE